VASNAEPFIERIAPFTFAIYALAIAALYAWFDVSVWNFILGLLN
jgi:hypothetical protein